MRGLDSASTGASTDLPGTPVAEGARGNPDGTVGTGGTNDGERARGMGSGRDMTRGWGRGGVAGAAGGRGRRRSER